MNASKISKLSIDQLKALKAAVEEELDNKKAEIEGQVKVTKIKDGTFRFELKGKSYEAQKQGVRGRFRVYKMDKGLKPGTLKRGEVVSREFTGGVMDLRSAIAFGNIK
tara:strand:+ start:318 stop:641 length:324 start_codon:yes stop_codon:yes gene_type:complete